MIKLRLITNNSCLKCDKVERELILVGAFTMCKECCEQEFGKVEEIDVESNLYKEKYVGWYKNYCNIFS